MQLFKDNKMYTLIQGLPFFIPYFILNFISLLNVDEFDTQEWLYHSATINLYFSGLSLYSSLVFVFLYELIPNYYIRYLLELIVNAIYPGMFSSFIAGSILLLFYFSMRMNTLVKKYKK